MEDSFVTSEECAATRRVNKTINALYGSFIVLIMGAIVWTVYSGYSAKARAIAVEHKLSAHQDVQIEHDKHIKEDLDDIKLMLRSIGAKVP